MARKLAEMPVRVIVVASLACLWCYTLAPVGAQEKPVQMPRVRMLVNSARESFKRGDYEGAAAYYAKAKALEKELSPTERADLSAQIMQNQTALQTRKDGAAQMRLAEEAFNKGRLQDATNLLRTLETNQYLASADKQTLANLQQRVRSTASSQAAKSDYKSLLTAARSALQNGDYELSIALANQADKVGTTIPPWMQPWNDSPAKVRRDVQLARSKATNGPALVPMTQEPKKEPTGPLQGVKNFIKGKDPKTTEEKNPPPAKFPASPPVVAKQQTVKYPDPPAVDRPKEPVVALPPKTATAQMKPAPKSPEIKPIHMTIPEVKTTGTNTARQLVQDGYKALEAGDYATAQRLANQAKQMRAEFDWREQNPDRLLADIQRRQQAKSAAPAQKSVSAEEARQLVRQARGLLQQDRIEEAEKACAKAASCTTARWGLFEDSPDKIRGDVLKARGKRDREESVRLMAEARKLYAQGNLHEAKARAWRAQQLHGPYGVLDLGDRPQKLLEEIHRAELAQKASAPTPPLATNQNQRPTSTLPLPPVGNPLAQNKQQQPTSVLPVSPVPLPVDNPLAQNKQQQPTSVPPVSPVPLPVDNPLAQNKQQQPTSVPPVPPVPLPVDNPLAQNKQQPTSVPPISPVPPIGNPLAQNKQQPTSVPPMSPVPPIGNPLAQNNPPPVIPSLNPAPAQVQQPINPAMVQAKLKAQGLVREARELESRGYLAEARQKAVEAFNLKVAFIADEDSPDEVLLSLSVKCSRRIEQLVRQAREQAFNTPTDPNRFQKALTDLQAARKLAQGFELDTFRIDQEAQKLQQAAAVSGVNPIAYLPGAEAGKAMASGRPGAENNRQLGMEKLDRARLEITHGNYGLGRKLAEEAMHPQYGVQQEASLVIRTIDVEEQSQRILTAVRNADAGLDAFRRGAYQQAASIFAAIDMKLLPADRARRVGEIMSTREMQTSLGGGLVQVDNKQVIGPDGKEAPGKASVGIVGGGDDLTKQFRALEEIQFQQLRDRGLTAERASIQRMNAGDVEGAMTVLKDYLDQLSQAQLDPERMNLLKRRVDTKLQQYKTIQAQRILDKNQDNVRIGQHSEAKYQQNIQRTQKEVAELLAQYRQLYKEGKYGEALAKARQAKELDPDNVAADAAIQMGQIIQNQRIWEEDAQRNGERIVNELRHDFGPHVDMSKPLSLNEEIWRRAQKRGDGKGISAPHRNPAEKHIESMLLKPVTMNWKDAPLHQIIDDLRAQCGINIVPDLAALKDANISLEQPLTLAVEKIGAKSALNLLLDQVRLTWVIDNEVLKITTIEKSRGQMKTVAYSITDLVIQVPDHPIHPVASMQDALSRHISGLNSANSPNMPSASPFSAGNGQMVGSSSSASGLGAALSHGHGSGMKESVSKSSPTNTIEDLLISLIKNTVRQPSWTDMGGPGTIQYFPLGHALIVNQTQEVQEEVLALLQSLRRLQDLEVAIEVKLVQVADSFFERIGVDFDLNILTPKSKFENQLLTNTFQPPGFINRFRPDRFISGLTPAGTFTSDLNVPIRGSSFDFSLPPFGNFPASLGNDGGISLGLAFLSDIQVFMFMEAAQGNRRLNVMQAPKITVFNGQTANIAVQDQLFFLINVQPTFFGNTLAFFPQNQPFPVGMTLLVNPVVSADRRFVRLNLNPIITGISGAAVPLIPLQFPIQTVFENGVGRTEFFQLFIQQPQFSTININTTVNVPDGGTVLLGGLKIVAEGRSEFGAPLLGKIPYLNRLFRNVGYGREAQSLMIMVTPRIIIAEEEEQIYLGNLPPIPRP